jgi:hypothetical protein
MTFFFKLLLSGYLLSARRLPSHIFYIPCVSPQVELWSI